jgi:hypothetical protein
MGDVIQLRPYFESGDDAEGILSAGADYAAGLRGDEDSTCDVHFKLGALDVETVVLARARLLVELDPVAVSTSSPWVSATGHRRRHEGRASAHHKRAILVEASLAPADLRMEDEPLEALASLRGSWLKL